MPDYSTEVGLASLPVEVEVGAVRDCLMGHMWDRAVGYSVCSRMDSAHYKVDIDLEEEEAELVAS